MARKSMLGLAIAVCACLLSRFTPASDGEHHLIATSDTDRVTGPFTITVGHPEVVLAVSGKLTHDDYYDPLNDSCYQKVHRARMKANQLYIVSLQSAAFQPLVRIESSRGKHVVRFPTTTRPDSADINFTPPRDDEYRIIVTTMNGGATGPYVLSVQK